MPHKPARRVLDRAAVARLTGASRGTVDKWHREREKTNFPKQAPGGGWYEDEIQTFWTTYQQARTKTLAKIDKSGDPNELVGTSEAARVLGYNSHNDLPDALREIADELTELPSGRTRRKWKRRTLWEFADTYRGGRQRTGRITGPRPNAPDLTGDPDELVPSSEAAHILGYSHRKHLPQHILDAADQVTTSTNGKTFRKWKRKTIWAFVS